MPDHGKLMHLFLVRAPGMDVFAHLHPSPVDDSSFRTPLPALPAGSYRVYADILHESGFTQTLTDTVQIPAVAAGLGGSLDADDSWSVAAAAAPAGGTAALEDGSAMIWTGEPSPRAEHETTLAFEVAAPDGAPADLEPYMGMAAHAAITRDDGSVFVHIHPLGTISMSSQMLFEEREAAGEEAPAAPPSVDHAAHAGLGPTVSFPYAFPSAGTYTVWVQVKREGKILTGGYTVEVAP